MKLKPYFLLIKRYQKEITTICVVGSFAFGIWQYLMVRNYQIKLDEVNHLLRAVQYEPRLKLVNSPIISPIEVSMKFVHPIPVRMTNDSQIFINSRLKVKVDTVQSPVNITDVIIHCELKFSNLEKSKATILGIAYTDTMSFLPKIREKLFHQDTTKFVVDYLTEPIELLPGESHSFRVNHSIQFLENNRFLLHFMVLYANEIGNIYDTYVWVPYQYHQIDTLGVFVLVPGEKPKMKMLHKSNEIVSIERDPISTYYPYTMEEANKLNQFFDLVRLQKKNR
jgi:hypothetical protein